MKASKRFANVIAEPSELINSKKEFLFAEKAWKIIQTQKMQGVDKKSFVMRFTKL